MKRLILILATISLCGIAALALFWPARPSFPVLATGIYFGEIRGAEGKPDSRIPIYVESISKTSSLLVVPLEAGVAPELHPLAPLPGSSDRCEPVVVRLSTGSVTLTGSRSGSSYSGTIEPSGTWSLSPLDTKRLRENTSALQASVELPRWLRVKAQAAASTGELAQLRDAFNQGKDRLKGLDNLLGNEKTLKERSQARREELASEINAVTAKKRKLAEDLRGALDDLSVLHRVRVDGQAVEVARRILKREERWFDGNSGSDQEDDSLEEQLAANDKVDLQKLNLAAKKAEEIQQLRRALAEEQSQVQILNAEYQRKVVRRVPSAGGAQ